MRKGLFVGMLIPGMGMWLTLAAWAGNGSVSVTGAHPAALQGETSLSGPGNDGLTLPEILPSLEMGVQGPGSVPTVTIHSPVNAETYKMNAPVFAVVDIASNSPLKTVSALLNDASVTLTRNTDDGNYEALLILTQPGLNTFTVEVCNSGGCGNASSAFPATYDFGAWLPPVTTVKFKSDRVLPVKFTVNDFYGPTDDAMAILYLDEVVQGQANVLYAAGIPYYHLNVRLNVPEGPHTIRVATDDGYTSVSKMIQVKFGSAFNNRYPINRRLK